MGGGGGGGQFDHSENSVCAWLSKGGKFGSIMFFGRQEGKKNLFIAVGKLIFFSLRHFVIKIFQGMGLEMAVT